MTKMRKLISAVAIATMIFVKSTTLLLFLFLSMQNSIVFLSLKNKKDNVLFFPIFPNQPSDPIDNNVLVFAERVNDLYL